MVSRVRVVGAVPSGAKMLLRSASNLAVGVSAPGVGADGCAVRAGAVGALGAGAGGAAGAASRVALEAGFVPAAARVVG